jgi:hypothetical protein
VHGLNRSGHREKRAAIDRDRERQIIDWVCNNAKQGTKSSLHKEQHLQVPRAFVERTSQDLNEIAEMCLAEPVLDLNEVGISDWKTAKRTK